MACARKRSEGRYGGLAGDHSVFLAHAVLGEVAPVVGGVLALVAGAQHPGVFGAVGCLAAGFLAAFAFEARLSVRSMDRLGIADLIDAAHEKPVIPLVAVAVAVL
ncbi:MAG: hypothetical protein M3Y91_15865, partial [Actinomycetota bacterium]|nr:hypothetical protein [Actinomycetota bacterium]